MYVRMHPVKLWFDAWFTQEESVTPAGEFIVIFLCFSDSGLCIHSVASKLNTTDTNVSQIITYLFIPSILVFWNPEYRFSKGKCAD